MDGSGRNIAGYDASGAHGHAALMLVESLLHNLIERSLINVEEALDIVATAIDATEEITDDFAVPSPELERSISLLTAISQSLKLIRGDSAA